MIFYSAVATANDLRIGLWHSGLTRDGPGMLVADLAKNKDPNLREAIDIIVALQADILLLTAFDYDHDQVAATQLRQILAQKGLEYPYSFATMPNSGLSSGLDLDQNGRLGQASDAQGWGRFAGQAGLLLLSKFPILSNQARDFSPFLWRDLPDTMMDQSVPEIAAIQRLSSTGHWDVPVVLPDQTVMHLLVWSATPPAFDGPEDRNGLRNHDEAAFWLAYLAGMLADAPPSSPFVVMGDAKLDPMKSKGRSQALEKLLAHPLLQDPHPRLPGGAPWGGEGLDTAVYAGLGGMRSDYILPGRGAVVRAAHVFAPSGFNPVKISKHYPVFVDLTLK